MTIKVSNNKISFGNGEFVLSFQRTLRIPEDGKTHQLPPSLGNFPIKRVEDYADKVPASWKEHGGIFIPMFQREAMWLSFGASKPHAVKVASGKINAVSGQPWNVELKEPTQVAGKDPQQDYVVCPDQPWLDGFNTGDGIIRQFVAMPLGMGYTVEGQLTGKEEFGGLQFLVIPAKPGAIKEPDYGNLRGYTLSADCHESVLSQSEDYYMPLRAYSKSAPVKPKAAEMGLAAGGKMVQKIYEDPHGIEVWDQENSEKLFVHIVNSEMYMQITGEAPPSSPIDAHTYTKYGYPWFELYDSDKEAVSGSGTLAGVKPVSQKDAEHGFVGQQDDSPLDESKNVKKIGKPAVPDKSVVKDGKW